MFKKNLIFIIPVLIFIISGIVFLGIFGKDNLQLGLNAQYSNAGDFIFKNLTHLGEGLMFALVGLSMLFIKWRYLAAFLLAGVLTLLLTGFLKQVVFKDYNRPAKYFENKAELRFVPNVKVHHHHSFPSGHTTAAFACWGLLAFVVKRKSLKFTLFILALSIGYSRIYLSQHFVEDVLAGAFLGTSIAYVSLLFSERIKGVWADKKIGTSKSD